MTGDTLLRQWTLLQLLPVHPGRRSTGDLATRLAEDGYQTSKRTVERDLEYLSGIFGFTCEKDHRTNHWYFPRQHRFLTLPGMDEASALALLLARDYSQSLIPPSTLNLLKPYFQKATDVLKDAAPRALADWRDRVYVATRGPVLSSPNIAESVQFAVYEAVLHRKQIRVTYRSRTATEKSDMVLHALALVFKDGVAYLVGTAWDYPDVRYYALHRILAAECLAEKSKAPEGFKLREFASKAFALDLQPRRLALRIAMLKEVAAHLLERPLSSDQTHEAKGDLIEISATVEDTAELRWWLQGFGSQVEVLAPKALRKEFAEMAQLLAQRYRREL